MCLLFRSVCMSASPRPSTLSLALFFALFSSDLLVFSFYFSSQYFPTINRWPAVSARIILFSVPSTSSRFSGSRHDSIPENVGDGDSAVSVHVGLISQLPSFPESDLRERVSYQVSTGRNFTLTENKRVKPHHKTLLSSQLLIHLTLNSLLSFSRTCPSAVTWVLTTTTRTSRGPPITSTSSPH